MKGDFSRSSFDPQKHYTSVRMQQGRVQLDADWNEQADITLHQLRTQLEDLVGNAGIPGGHLFSLELDFVGELDAKDQVSETLRAQFLKHNVALASSAKIETEQAGSKWTVVSTDRNDDRKYIIQKENQVLNVYPSDFLISHVTNEQSQLDFSIGAGRCYVDGILCINKEECQFTAQEDYPGASQKIQTNDKAYIVYLDVWERHITALEDPDIREAALGGIDTTTRTKAVWQVKVKEIETTGVPSDDESEKDKFVSMKQKEFTIEKWKSFLKRERFDDIEQEWQEYINTKRQAAVENKWREFIANCAGGPNLTAHVAKSAFIQQNQLYRVEIHHSKAKRTTVKWSRDNGSVVYPITWINAKSDTGSGYDISVNGSLGTGLELKRGNWVEIVNDRNLLRSETLPLFKVDAIEPDLGKVTLQSESTGVLSQWCSFNIKVLQELIDNLKEDVPVPDEFHKQFQKEGKSLTSKARVKVEQSGNRWKIIDDGKLYHVRRETKPSSALQELNIQEDLDGIHMLLRRWDHEQGSGYYLCDGAILLQEYFHIPTDLKNELDASKDSVPQALRDELKKHCIELGESACVKITQPGSQWEVTDSDKSCRIQLDNQNLTVSISCQSISLENGIEMSFSGSEHCKVGDYWLIPARANGNEGVGDIVWPKGEAQPPHGIEHHYAPLAVIQQVEGTWKEYGWKDLRFRTLPALTAFVDNLHKRVKMSEEHIDALAIHIEALKTTVENLNNQLGTLKTTVEDLNKQLGTLETTVKNLNHSVTTLKNQVKTLNKRLQSLENLRRVEWWLVVVIAVLLLLFFTPLFFTPQEGRWFVAIILLISGGLFWGWQKQPPSKGDGASK